MHPAALTMAPSGAELAAIVVEPTLAVVVQPVAKPTAVGGLVGATCMTALTATPASRPPALPRAEQKPHVVSQTAGHKQLGQKRLLQ